MSGVLAFLAALDCRPSAVIVQTHDLHRIAYYERGTVYTRSTDPAVLVHELWHDCQRQRLGDAWSAEEQARREAEAHRVEAIWRADR
jgi:hypothetical protein